MLVIINISNKGRVQPMVKYFTIQVVGSATSVIGFMCLDIWMHASATAIIITGLLIKRGFFPFHSWVPTVVIESRWLSAFLILTWQKLRPMFIITSLPNNIVLYLRCFFMPLVGAVGGLNQNRARAMSCYSSFVHNSWMLASLFSATWIFMLYFFFYSFSLGLFYHCCYCCGKRNLKTHTVTFLGAVRVLILTGVPPFMGFYIKFLVILTFPHFFLVPCILGSVISMKFYLAFIFSFLINRSHKARVRKRLGGLFFLSI